MAISHSTQTRFRAAQCVRMSTEHQQYLPENQLDIIRQYAADLKRLRDRNYQSQSSACLPRFLTVSKLRLQFYGAALPETSCMVRTDYDFLWLS